MNATMERVVLGVRPRQQLKVTTADGQVFDLGWQVAGDDVVARLFQWLQRRKVAAYCRARLATLEGSERADFAKQMETMKGSR